MTRRQLALALLVSSLFLACEDSTKAIEPMWGKQSCSSCSMLVSDKRYAAELVTARGDRMFFDDPGCLAAYLVAHGEHDVAASWVRDLDGRWLTPETARFESGAKTPMDYGFAVAENGRLDWASVIAAARARNGLGGRS